VILDMLILIENRRRAIPSEHFDAGHEFYATLGRRCKCFNLSRKAAISVDRFAFRSITQLS
jgi:hypothetical protein